MSNTNLVQHIVQNNNKNHSIYTSNNNKLLALSKHSVDRFVNRANESNLKNAFEISVLTKNYISTLITKFSRTTIKQKLLVPYKDGALLGYNDYIDGVLMFIGVTWIDATRLGAEQTKLINSIKNGDLASASSYQRKLTKGIITPIIRPKMKKTGNNTIVITKKKRTFTKPA